MKRISIYVKSGLKAATTYYRLWQYLQHEEFKVKINRMLSDRMYDKLMPIYNKLIYVKLYVFACAYFRVLFQLIKDVCFIPDVLILSRRFINRTFPYSYKFLIKILKYRGCRIIWDFDDEIIVKKEIPISGFIFMSKISHCIVVASEVNKEMVPSLYRHKVRILPTTDGDIYKYNSQVVMMERMLSFSKEIRIVWVGTSVSLPFVKTICSFIDDFANMIISKSKKTVRFVVVCNEPLKYENRCFVLDNIKWERNIAIKEMLKAHIGIMPLDNSIESKAKGGFKLIQYLSAGLPVVGSAVGINNKIISSDVGFAIPDLKSNCWYRAFCDLTDNINNWVEYSRSASCKWYNYYNFKTNDRLWREIINT